MKLHRIFTENINYTDIVARLQLLKLDATIIQANGLWQGKAEKSLVIEIVDGGDMQTQGDIDGLAYWLKKHNKQEAVMLQTIDVECQLL